MFLMQRDLRSEQTSNLKIMDLKTAEMKINNEEVRNT